MQSEYAGLYLKHTLRICQAAMSDDLSARLKSDPTDVIATRGPERRIRNQVGIQSEQTVGLYWGRAAVSIDKITTHDDIRTLHCEVLCGAADPRVVKPSPVVGLDSDCK